MAGGNNVCNQIRVKRLTSLTTIVVNATHCSWGFIAHSPRHSPRHAHCGVLWDSTRDTKSSSRRLVLLRILTTLIPWSFKLAKRVLID